MALKSTPIAEEARIAVVLTFLSALGVLVFFGIFVSMPLWLLALLLMYLYRDPARKIPASPLGVVSPIDGQVVLIEKATDTLLERESLVIVIAMSSLGPYVIRSPAEGKVMQQWHRALGRGYGQWIQTDEQDDVLFVIQPRVLSGRLSCRVSAGERIGQGARCGFLRFGKELRLYLPANSILNVKKSDRVLAGEDILASLVHSENY